MLFVWNFRLISNNDFFEDDGCTSRKSTTEVSQTLANFRLMDAGQSNTYRKTEADY